MDDRLSMAEKRALLGLARAAIEVYLCDGSLVDLPEASGVFAESCGAFVTLHKDGQLRGCIGSMVGHAPLVETIREMAIAAATKDPRFGTVKSSELSHIDLEISVLSPMKRIKDVEEIEIGKHGILMKRGMQQGVLLPQVATEYGWSRQTFLEHTCQKSGLSSDAWMDSETVIEIFSADVFAEKETCS